VLYSLCAGNKVFKYYGYRRLIKKKVTSKGYPKAPQAALIGRDGRIYLFQVKSFRLLRDVRILLSLLQQQHSFVWCCKLSLSKLGPHDFVLLLAGCKCSICFHECRCQCLQLYTLFCTLYQHETATVISLECRCTLI